MQVFRSPALAGRYALSTSDTVALQGVSTGLAGKVRIAAGVRSPEQGMRSSAAHEIGYVIHGRLRIESAQGQQDVAAGDMLVMSPAEPHSTTALEDSEIFFVLLDPLLAPAR